MSYDLKPLVGRDANGHPQDQRSVERLDLASKLWSHRRADSEPVVPLSPRRETIDEVLASRRMPAVGERAFTFPAESLWAPESHQKPLVVQPSDYSTTAREIVIDATNVPLPPSDASSASSMPSGAGIPLPLSTVPSETDKEVQSYRSYSPTPRSAHTKSSEIGSDLMGLQTIEASKTNISLDAEWNLIEKRRNDVMGLQSKVSELRRSMRSKQITKSALEDQLFQELRMNAMGVTLRNRGNENEAERIENLMQRCQDARDVVGPIEYDCIQLEDQLYDDEFQLRRLEASFFAKLKALMKSKHSSSDVFESDKAPSIISESLDEDYQDLTTHPLVTQYLSKLGDLELLQEQLDEILDEREQLEEQREIRKRVGMNLGIEEQQWLEDAQRMEDEAEERLRVVEVEVEELRQECLKKNLIDEDGEPTNLTVQEQKIFQQDEIDSDSLISEYSKYPTLLTRPKVVQQPEYDLPPGHAKLPSEKGSESTGGRVNIWILRRLLASPLEIEHLARIYETECGRTGDWWEKSVLDLWFGDGTVEQTAKLRAYNASVSARVQHHSDISTDSSDMFGESKYVVDIHYSPGSHSEHSTDTKVAHSSF